jgi:ACS family sodium-dependent inorganic phosphate cotransporter
MVQILGGIWADRFGGKVVLGFGVVWWSIATVLTPLAAKIGLPCLLITRAFMGIGEVIMSSACLYTMYCIITLYRLLCMKCEH